MSKLLCLAGVLTLLTACAAPPAPAAKPDGYASPTGAAFLGYHGPVYRLNPIDER